MAALVFEQPPSENHVLRVLVETSEPGTFEIGALI
jgi:hypothetical protein